MYKSEIITRPDGTSYVRVYGHYSNFTKELTEDQILIANQLKEWGTTEQIRRVIDNIYESKINKEWN